MRRRFSEKAPSSDKFQDGKYSDRPMTSLRSHFSTMAADVQKFSVSLRQVRACNPTGVNEEDIISMAIAIHVGRANKIYYQFKEYCKTNWLQYKACLILRHHPKFMDPSEMSDSFRSNGPNSTSFHQPCGPQAPLPPIISSTDENILLDSAAAESERSAPVQKERQDRYKTGVRNAK